MNQLTSQQNELVMSLANQLATIPGIIAVVLGGSYARGRAQVGSDIDLGLLYSESGLFSLEKIRELAKRVNDTANPVVSDFYGWGAWVNGGAWLTIGGQRVDLLYRSLEHLERVIADAEAGHYQVDYLQQPPFGFFSGTYLSEITICIPLIDPEERFVRLKQMVAEYPEALRRALVQDYLWQAEFGLGAFATKYAARGDSYGTVACLARTVNQLVLALFALNQKYPVNDKTVLAEIAEFSKAPQEFGPRVQLTLAQVGSSPAELGAAVERISELLRETVQLAGELYKPRYALPR
jgi:predicted nucleotidyltransferase